ncbi:DMT family transporter [Nocardioides sp. R1-1]|uniref:DMT family transporter n=1 Tax=Nocardioides sp. R1-1 TaxID=3383502 RepID=UPI0038D14EDA
MTRATTPGSGWAALGATVLLWASFALSSRAIGDSSLTAYDAALLRFGVPLLVLAPLLPRTVRALARERASTVVLLLAGGLPHYLLFALGADLTSAGLTGLLVPGTVPLFVTLLLLGSRRVPARGWAALGAIVAGVAASATGVGDGAGLPGIAVLLLAGAVWAVYTLGLQRTALRPLELVVVVCAGSAVGGLLLVLAGPAPSHLLVGSVRLTDLLGFVLLQGIGTGLLSTLCYAHAVRTLGGGTAAVGGALSPVATAVLAVPLFGEAVGPGLASALVLVVAGVVGFHAPPRPRGRPDQQVLLAGSPANRASVQASRSVTNGESSATTDRWSRPA